MDDLTAKLSQILSSEEGMQQLQNLAASLGLVGNNNAGSSPKPPVDLSALSSLLGQGGNSANSQNGQNEGGQANNGTGIDMNTLSSILGQFTGGQSGQNDTNSAPSGGLDLSALSSILGNLGNGANNGGGADASGGLNLGALASMLGGLGGAGQGADSGGSPPINMQTIVALQKAMGTLKSDDKNISLMRALKPHFSPERCKKVDDAVRIMQMIKLLPLIKESGILGSLGGDLF